MLLKPRHRLADGLDLLGAAASDAVVVDVARDAAGHDRVHEVAMAEERMIHAQPVFPQPRELREPERKPRIVAEKSEVPQMLADALALEQQRAQPQRARRRRHRGSAFHRHRVRPRVRDGRIARDAPGEPRALRERQ